jgi:hypothetical protein
MPKISAGWHVATAQIQAGRSQLAPPHAAHCAGPRAGVGRMGRQLLISSEVVYGALRWGGRAGGACCAPEQLPLPE